MYNEHKSCPLCKADLPSGHPFLDEIETYKLERSFNPYIIFILAIVTGIIFSSL